MTNAYSTDVLLEQWTKEYAGKLAYVPGQPVPEWQQELRTSFEALLGELPDTDSELNPQLLERQECEGYVRERIELTTRTGVRMPVYVLTPATPLRSPMPAMLAVHGHGYGSREIVGLMPDGSERAGMPGLHKDFASDLARRGFLVVAPELLGFGDRRLAEDLAGEPGQSSCFRLSAQLMLLGQTIAGWRIHEMRRVLDYLQTRPDVDPTRIGTMGISGGGLVCGFTAALDDRIRCAVISGYASTFEGSILTRQHCLDNYIPGVLQLAEMPDLLGLVAPRPIFLEVGEEDRVFPAAAARKAFARLETLYAAAGAETVPAADFFDGGHEIHGEPAYDWLEAQLAR
ncbi:dienelactone hydrolase family protein [Paenibacillus daejeonensis]|uniref:dienelactone hydrolase family protein n=1 Tax=Paenibacillus daejeonensis TaxID=135193 RepID=UPI0003713DA0|nr:alpha/beta hydrolase family protein [Paenibacillus daejeonensis]